MPIDICFATPSLASRLARIHVSAFASNRLMRAIYPTPAIWAAFERAVEEKMTADMLDENTSVIVARSTAETKEGEEGEIVGFAVWSHATTVKGEQDKEEPSGDAETHSAPRWNLPHGTDWDVLNAWRHAAAKVAQSVVGHGRHYELAWIAVSPGHARQGVGKMLLRWGLDACDEQNVPAYVESTVEAAGAFYAKAGFEEKGRIQLVVKGQLYEEIACLYEPCVSLEKRSMAQGRDRRLPFAQSR